MLSATTIQGDKFHQRYINGSQILVQQNRLGVWHGYINQIWKCEFEGEQKAIYWLKNYPMADVE